MPFVQPAANARRGVVVGGGLLGLEAANALKSLGLEAHVVEFAPRLMPVQLDDFGGLALKAQIERLGVGVHLSRATQSISGGERYRYRMNFAERRVPRNRPYRVLRRHPCTGRPGAPGWPGDWSAWRGGDQR